MTGSVVERYLRLGLQVGRHVDGIVDAYFGPPKLAAAVEAEPPVEPQALVASAEALLAELDHGWLRDQVVGLHGFARVLAGDSGSYADEVEECYGVRPTWTDESVFAAAHDRLEEVLPGEGQLAERLESWKASIRVPLEQLERVVAAVIDEARAWTRRLVDLPDGEGVEVEIVRDKPWLAYCEYRGDLQSQIAINVDEPQTAIELLVLTMHETYPGHHAERCSKEALLVRERGLLEETVVLVPTPQSLVSEGIASLAPDMLLQGEAGEALASVVHDSGIRFDLAQALAVRHAHQPCGWASVNAALLLHERGASEAEVRAYFERWAVETPQVAAHLVRFLTEPTSRSYILTYLAGQELCRAYVGGEPARFRRLLTEQVRVSDLLEAS